MKATLEDVAARLHRLEAISVLLNDLEANPALTIVANDFVDTLRKLQSLLEEAHKESKSARAWAVFKAAIFSKDAVAEWNHKLDAVGNDLQLALVVVLASNSLRKEKPVYEARDEDDSLQKPKHGKLVGVDVTEPEKPIITDFQSALPGSVSDPVTSPITSPEVPRKHPHAHIAKGTDSPSSTASGSPSLSPSGSTKEVSATRAHRQAGIHAPSRSALPPIDQNIVTNLIVTHRLRQIEQVRRGYLKIEDKFVGGVFIQCRRLDPFFYRLYFFPNDAQNIRYLVYRSFSVDDVTKKIDDYVTPQEVKDDREAENRSASPAPAHAHEESTPAPTAEDKDKKKKDKKDLKGESKRDSKDEKREKDKKEKSKDKKDKK